MQQLAEGPEIGTELHHDELAVSLPLPCVEVGPPPHLHCLDQALTLVSERYFTFHIERATWVQVNTIFCRLASVQTAKRRALYKLHHEEGDDPGDYMKEPIKYTGDYLGDQGDLPTAE